MTEADTRAWEGGPEHVARLTVGARVRIRVSPETELKCPNCGAEYDPTVYNGEIGAIIATVIPPVALYCIKCGKPWPHPPSHRFVVHIGDSDSHKLFAAVELTPLDTPPPQPGRVA